MPHLEAQLKSEPEVLYFNFFFPFLNTFIERTIIEAYPPENINTRENEED